MSVERIGDVIHVIGNAPVGDAEPLLAALHEEPSCRVDLSAAGHLHSAVVQILLAVRPRMLGAPAYPLFANYVLPRLDRGKGTA